MTKAQESQHLTTIANLGMKMRQADKQYMATRSQANHESKIGAEEAFDAASQAYLEAKNPLLTVTLAPDTDTDEATESKS